jgi:hypothetical protein
MEKQINSPVTTDTSTLANLARGVSSRTRTAALAKHGNIYDDAIARASLLKEEVDRNKAYDDAYSNWDRGIRKDLTESKATRDAGRKEWRIATDTEALFTGLTSTADGFREVSDAFKDDKYQRIQIIRRKAKDQGQHTLSGEDQREIYKLYAGSKMNALRLKISEQAGRETPMPVEMFRELLQKHINGTHGNIDKEHGKRLRDVQATQKAARQKGKVIRSTDTTRVPATSSQIPFSIIKDAHGAKSSPSASNAFKVKDPKWLADNYNGSSPGERKSWQKNGGDWVTKMNQGNVPDPGPANLSELHEVIQGPGEDVYQAEMKKLGFDTDAEGKFKVTPEVLQDFTYIFAAETGFGTSPRYNKSPTSKGSAHGLLQIQVPTFISLVEQNVLGEQYEKAVGLQPGELADLDKKQIKELLLSNKNGANYLAGLGKYFSRKMFHSKKRS